MSDTEHGHADSQAAGADTVDKDDSLDKFLNGLTQDLREGVRVFLDSQNIRHVANLHGIHEEDINLALQSAGPELTLGHKAAIRRLVSYALSIREVPTVDRISLDVGGTSFVSSIETLRSLNAKSSFFEQRFAGRFGDRLDSIFIDRSPKHFSCVLDFLRSGHCTLPNTLNDLRELWHEADYYSLTPLRNLSEKTAMMTDFFTDVVAGATQIEKMERGLTITDLDEKSKAQKIFFETSSVQERARAIELAQEAEARQAREAEARRARLASIRQAVGAL